jgi:hypothetical protein
MSELKFITDYWAVYWASLSQSHKLKVIAYFAVSFLCGLVWTLLFWAVSQ